jgi:hypothetical protein
MKKLLKNQKEFLKILNKQNKDRIEDNIKTMVKNKWCKCVQIIINREE